MNRLLIPYVSLLALTLTFAGCVTNDRHRPPALGTQSAALTPTGVTQQGWSQVEAPPSLQNVSVASPGFAVAVDTSNVLWLLTPTGWVAQTGQFTQAAIGGDGAVWAIEAGGGGAIELLQSGTWTPVTGSLAQVSALSAQAAWGVNSAGTISAWSPTSSTPLSGGSLNAAFVSAAQDLTVWAVDTGSNVYAWNAPAAQWLSEPGALSSVAVGSASFVWGLSSDGGVWQWNGTALTEVPAPQATWITATATNVLIVDTTGAVWQYGNAGTDAGPCAAAGCPATTACAADGGAFTCQGICPSGYTGTYPNCVDVDECSTGNGGCDPNRACLNIAGSFACGNCASPLLAYDLPNTGPGTCLLVPQPPAVSDGFACLADGGCYVDQHCTTCPANEICETDQCDCPYPNVLVGAGTCVTPPSSCAVDNGGCAPAGVAICTPDGGQNSCSCPQGWWLPPRTAPSGNFAPGAGNGAALSKPAPATCCPYGYTIDSTGACVEYHAPGSEPCFPYDPVCAYQGLSSCPSGFYSSAVDGYSGNDVSGGICLDIDECALNNGGCAAGVPCKNYAGGYTCGGPCPAGYQDTGTACTPIDHCSGSSPDGLADCFNVPAADGHLTTIWIDPPATSYSDGLYYAADYCCTAGYPCGFASCLFQVQNQDDTASCETEPLQPESGDLEPILCGDLYCNPGWEANWWINAPGPYVGGAAGGFLSPNAGGFLSLPFGYANPCLLSDSATGLVSIPAQPDVLTDPDLCAANNGGCDPLTTCTLEYGAAAVICSECPSGFRGIGSTGCTDVDECATTNGGCDPRTYCENEPGSFKCGPCPAAFQPDPQNVCIWATCPSSDCGNRSCSGSHLNCVCPPGSSAIDYYSDAYTPSPGTLCADINECETLSNGGCPGGSTCINVPDGRICAPSGQCQVPTWCPPGLTSCAIDAAPEGMACSPSGICSGGVCGAAGAGDAGPTALGVSPSVVVIAPGTGYSFTAAGGVGPYTWSIYPGGIGLSIDESTGAVTTSPLTLANDYTVTVMDSASPADTAWATLTLALQLDPINPPSAEIAQGDSFSAFTTSGGSGPLTWSVSPHDPGMSITPSSGKITTTSSVTPGTYTVSATDGYWTVSASLIVAPALALTPSSQTVEEGSTVTFLASGGAGGFHWSVESTTGGALTASCAGAPQCMYSAGRAGTDTVSVADDEGHTVQAIVHVVAAEVPDAGSAQPTDGGSTEDGAHSNLPSDDAGEVAVQKLPMHAGETGSTRGCASASTDPAAVLALLLLAVLRRRKNPAGDV